MLEDVFKSLGHVHDLESMNVWLQIVGLSIQISTRSFLIDLFVLINGG